ncbi:D-alanyl-lipoteichoic acid biosynthesis protein DltB [soil metagenome]
MGVVSPVFFGVTLSAALAIRYLGAYVSRELVLIIASALFIFCIAGNVVATLPFWLLVFGGYLIVKNAHHARAPLALVMLVMLVVLAWWWLRLMAQTYFLYMPAGLPGSVAVFGLSYAMFRIIHLTIDARDDELGSPLRLRAYLCYLSFFPNYLAGPVQRYQHFAPQVALPAAPIGTTTLGLAGIRASSGLFKCTVLAGSALMLHQTCIANSTVQNAGFSAALLATAALAFAAYLYFSFAGYVDLAICAGKLLGIDIPENFAQPLRAKNFLDFWSRWHITLSDWFRFYVFNPTLKVMLARIERPSLAPYLGAAGYFLAFFLMGIWHGRTPALIVYGLILGSGVSVNKLFQVWIVKRLGRRPYAALCERPGYQVFAQALALGYFVLALGFLWEPVPDFQRLDCLAMTGAAVMIFVACAVLAALTRWFTPGRTILSMRWSWLIAAVQAVAAAVWLWQTQGHVPKLIYQWL